MSKIINYRQCQLVKKTDDIEIKIVSYIPDKFAKLGEYVKLKDNEGKWTDGWRIMFVSAKLVGEDVLPDPHSEIKAHRRATGDSLPKE